MSFSRNMAGVLCVEGLSLTDIAGKYGTPCYVYSQTALVAAYERIVASFPQSKPAVHYAVKANDNLSLLKILAQAGCGFDIVSGGELNRVLAAGGRADKTVFSGVGKSAAEIHHALIVGVDCFNVESSGELHRIETIATECDKKARVALRLTPNIDGGTHPHLTTGISGSKFGVFQETALSLASQATESKFLEFVGFSCHLGSQIFDEAVFLAEAQAMAETVSLAQKRGLTVSRVDMGGGFAVNYDTGGGLAAELKKYDETLARLFGGLNILIEPGRSIVAATGVLLCKVEYLRNLEETDPTSAKNWLIIDAGMNDFMRPAMYDASHRIEAVLSDDSGAATETYTIAGPVCESTDIMARDVRLSIKEGDELAIMDAGAYGAVMASNYNARPRPSEVLAQNGQTTLIRRRETLDDMLALERGIKE